MSSSWSRSYGEFVQACRSFRPSDLIPAIARVSASLGEPPYLDEVKLKLPPWGLAVAARESFLYGNEHRSKAITPGAMDDLMRRFFHSEARPVSQPGDDGFLLSLLTPVLYEQFPWQESIFEELARSHAMLIEGLDSVDAEVISEAALEELLGAPLGEAIGATFVLQVGAYQNGGTFDSGWLDQENFKDVLALYPRRIIEAAAWRLTATRAEFKDDYKQKSHGDKNLARYDYNPLVRTPFVTLSDETTVAPSPRLIMRTVTPGGLYYPGLDRYGTAFTRDLGRLFEHYIGRNLRLINGAEVHGEVVYGHDQKSVDWFVVLPGLTILIECKLKRLGLSARAGDASLFDDMAKSVMKAHRQLARTVEKLADRTPEFGHIPSDRPILGMIVSAEPTYTGAAYLVERQAASIRDSRLSDIPVAVLSARELEMLVTHGADVEQIILERLGQHVSGTAFALGDIGSREGRKNELLEDAWGAYPFPQVEPDDD